MNAQRIIAFVLFFIFTQQILVKASASVNDLGAVLNDIYDNVYEKSSKESEQKPVDVELNLIEQLLNKNLDKPNEAMDQKNQDNSKLEEKASKAKKSSNDAQRTYPDCNSENKLLLDKLLRYALRCDMFLRNSDLFNKRNLSFKNKMGQLSLKDFLTMRY